MFYQKYRPQSFSQVFGNKQIVNSLQNALKQQKVGHAYLFYGPRGTGKTTMARLLAKSLLCENYSKKGEVCNTCDSCKQVTNGTYPDLIEIDAASNNSVENIRYINEKIGLAPTMGKLKFYIIDEVHMLSKGAFNALLKTLEEPPKNTYFALATTEPEKVIDTIKSRCQQFELKRASSSDVVDKLKYIVKQEKIDIPEKDLLKIAEASRGGFRDAETMLETVAVSGTSVDEVLNTVGVDFTVRFFDSIIAKNSPLAIELVNKVYDSGKNLEVWNKEVLTYLRNVMLVSQNLESLVVESEVNKKLIKDQSSNFSRSFLLKCLKNFNQSLESLKVSYVPTLPLEIAVLEIVGEADVNSNLEDGPKNGGDRIPSPSHPGAEQSEAIGSGSQDNLKNQDEERTSSDKSAKAPKIGGLGNIQPPTSNEEKNPSDVINSSVSEAQSRFIGKESIDVTSAVKAEEIDPTLSTSPSASDSEAELSSVIPDSDPASQQGGPESNNDKGAVVTNDIDPNLFKWAEYVKIVSEKRPSIATILKNCEYVGIEQNAVVVQAQFLFHKERLEFPSNRTLLIECAKEILGSSCSFSCVLKKYAKKNLTDKNVQYVTVNENEIPKFESSKPKKDKHGEFAIPTDDESFVASPVTIQEQMGASGAEPEQAIEDFSGEFAL